MGNMMPGLTPAEIERLAVLMEEMAEAQHMIGKILRHGWNNEYLKENGLPSNRQCLEEELGQVRAAMILCCEKGDVDRKSIHAHADQRRQQVKQWLHHQT